jgi:hypothetical protein
MLLDRWKNVCPDVQGSINNVKKACTRMWTEADEILEMYHMPLNEELNQAGPSENRTEQVVAIREKEKQEIEVLDIIDRETINQYMIQLVKCMLATKDFAKSMMKYLKT